MSLKSSGAGALKTEIKGNIGFLREGETEYLEKNPSEQSRELTNSTHMSLGIDPGHIGGVPALPVMSFRGSGRIFV